MSIGLKRVPFSGGRKQGPNKWGEEVFGEGDYNKTVREITQNSSDNPKDKDQSEPVNIKIESFEINVSDIPESYILKESFKHGLAELKETYDPKGIACTKFSRAINVLSKEKITILKFSDYNTKGLYGEWDDTKSPIYRFFASIGFSIENGEGGGSRGHGKTAPFNLSKINTVFYSSHSKHNNKDQFTYFGSTDLIYFKNNKGQFNGEIFYCDHDGATEYKAISFNSLKEAEGTIPPWMMQRTQEGTDVYVVGFEPPTDDWKELIIKSYMRNFYAAIIDHKITVEINGSLLDNKSIYTSEYLNLFDETDRRDRTLQYIDTYINGHSETRDLPLLGNCCVKVLRKEGYSRSYDLMRSRKMMIEDQRKRAWSSYDYAAVFCCESSEGSKILRKTEGSTHRKWDFKSIRNGEKYRIEIRDFIRDVVTKIAGNGSSEEEDIQVAELFSAGIGLTGIGQDSISNKLDDNETGRKSPGMESFKKELVAKDGTVIIDSSGKLRRKKGLVKKKKKRKKRTNQNIGNKKKTFSVSDF
jgi:hypothetical protein